MTKVTSAIREACPSINYLMCFSEEMKKAEGPTGRAQFLCTRGDYNIPRAMWNAVCVIVCEVPRVAEIACDESRDKADGIAAQTDNPLVFGAAVTSRGFINISEVSINIAHAETIGGPVAAVAGPTVAANCNPTLLRALVGTCAASAAANVGEEWWRTGEVSLTTLTQECYLGVEIPNRLCRGGLRSQATSGHDFVFGTGSVHFGRTTAPRLSIETGTAKPPNVGGKPNSVHIRTTRDGKAVQSTIYNDKGEAIGHIDWKDSEGHIFDVPGQPATGHGPGHDHLPLGDLPADSEAVAPWRYSGPPTRQLRNM